MADLKIEIKRTPQGPVLTSWYGDALDASYRPALGKNDLKAMVDQVVNEWFRNEAKARRS